MRTKHESINIDLVTGEVTAYAAGSKMQTPQEANAAQDYFERKNKDQEDDKVKKYFRRSQFDGLGTYVLLRIRRIPKPEDLSAANLCRLVYLSTYCDYNNRLMANEHKVMQREDFDSIMNLSPRKTRGFIADMKAEGYLFERDGEYFISSKFLYRGERKEKTYTDKMAVYVKAARSLYLHLDTRRHQYFGMMIRLLPYVNRSYNIVCPKEDVTETDIDKIRCLTITDICEILDYGEEHYQDLLAALTGLFFEVDGFKQAAFSCVSYTAAPKAGYMLIFNPRLFYVGEDYKVVLGYSKFFPKTIRSIKQTHVFVPQE